MFLVTFSLDENQRFLNVKDVLKGKRANLVLEQNSESQNSSQVKRQTFAFFGLSIVVQD